MASAPITHPLPKDIIEDILARLPVKSLKRFRCVGKSWCSLIQSPQFISAHFSFSKNKAYPIVLHTVEEKNVISIITNQTLDIVANVDMLSFTDEEPSAYIRGYCNGIICLWSCDGTVLLWNIATKEFKTLPVCPFESPPDFNNDVDVVCLGYDCMRDDYKVIRIDTFWNHDFEYEDPRSMRGKRVALYSLSTDSWKKLDANLTDVELFHYRLATSQFYSNGFFHCKASTENENEMILLSFDMSSEVFVTTPFPDGTENTVFYLMEVNGSVGGVCQESRETDGCYAVWVLGEIGVKKSWIKLFTIGPVLKPVRPICVGCDGEVFFRDYLLNFLVWHHPSNREIKGPRIQGNTLEVAMYAESLVSLRGGSAFDN